jgi:thioredoxin 1
MTDNTEQNTQKRVPGRKDFIWILAVIALMAVVLIAQRSYFRKEKPAASGDILHLSEDNFSRETSQGVVMVDYWATWCRPCRAMEPVLEEIALQYKGKAKIVKVDVDQNRPLASEAGINVIPTLIIYLNGLEQQRFTGMQEAPVLSAALDEAIALAGNKQK